MKSLMIPTAYRTYGSLLYFLRPNSIPDFSAHFVHFVHKMSKQTRTKQLYTRFFSHFVATKKNRTKNPKKRSRPTDFLCKFVSAHDSQDARRFRQPADGRPLSHVFGYRTCRNAQRVRIGYRVRFFSHTLCISCTACW